MNAMRDFFPFDTDTDPKSVLFKSRLGLHSGAFTITELGPVSVSNGKCPASEIIILHKEELNNGRLD